MKNLPRFHNRRTYPHSCLKFLPVLLAFWPLVATAQPRLAQGQTEAELSLVYVAESDLETGPAAGQTSVQQVTLGTKIGLLAANSPWSLSAGLDLDWLAFDASRGAPVPDELRATALTGQLGYRFSESWSASVVLSPGSYADADSFSDGFTVPGLALFSYAYDRSLTFAFGLRWSPFADNPLLPIAGLRWQIDERWLLNLGLPRAGVAYQLDTGRQLFAGVSLAGGAYHVAAVDGQPGLKDTKVDYRQIRVGGGADLDLSEQWSLTLEVGLIVDQKWDYYDRHFEVKSDDTPLYARIATVLSF